MDLTAQKLSIMAAEDGVTEEEFVYFAGEVCQHILKHSPDGSFKVILPKTRYQHPVGVSAELTLKTSPSFRDNLVELMYRLRECAPGQRTITMVDVSG